MNGRLTREEVLRAILVLRPEGVRPFHTAEVRDQVARQRSNYPGGGWNAEDMPSPKLLGFMLKHLEAEGIIHRDDHRNYGYMGSRWVRAETVF